jgi:hypothetical protein
LILKSQKETDYFNEENIKKADRELMIMEKVKNMKRENPFSELPFMNCICYCRIQE